MRGSARKLLAFGQEHSPFLLVCAGAAGGLVYAGRLVRDLYAKSEAANYERQLGGERSLREVEAAKAAMLERLVDYGFAQEYMNLRQACKQDGKIVKMDQARWTDGSTGGRAPAQ